MPIFDPETILCVQRSRPRARTLLILEKEGALTAARLAHFLGWDTRKLWWLMEGDGDRYSKERALVVLGLVREVRTRRRVVYELTDSGVALAKFLREFRRSSPERFDFG